MTRKILIRMISDLLKKRFPLESLKAIRRLLNSGALMNVFSDAVDKAIETATSDDFAKGVLEGTDGQDHESYSDTQDHESYVVNSESELE